MTKFWRNFYNNFQTKNDNGKILHLFSPIFVFFMLFFALMTIGILEISTTTRAFVGDSISFSAPSLSKTKVMYNGEEPSWSVMKQQDQVTTLELTQEGIYDVQTYLGGFLPLKNLTVEVVAPTYVVPGGNSIGILLQTKGVTVVGHSPVIRQDGGVCYPAKEAGLLLGDFVTLINDTEITKDSQVADLINKLGASRTGITMTVNREGQLLQIPVQPVYCTDSKTYRIGLYVRDNTAGVGTLTFYDPQNQWYGALGHPISGQEDKQVDSKDKGSIVRASIQGIKQGEKGNPGEKLGSFMAGKWKGNILANTNVGIFGVMEKAIENPYFDHPIPVALPTQVREGKAELYTVLEGEKIEAFEINIVKTYPNHQSTGKGMVIEVTDSRLLMSTGGIIQGMSGSPIVQNGKLVGAVTHVFVNDPTKGYGCFATWMLDEIP